MWLRPLLVLLPSVVWAINYKCQNDQVLVVQSFGNDTIRMHCQRLDLCGYQKLRCDYDEHQPNCGGQMNFVAHVHQTVATSPVEHTCCNLFNPRPPHIVTTHAGNDCFIYELPDGSSVAKPKEEAGSEPPLTVLKSAAEIPEHIDGISGYRLRLFLLKNKAPPTLLVKGIERRLEGYRVTICRPRCTSIAAAGQEREARKGADDGSEWKAISWSSWTSTSWTTWARSASGNSATRVRTREELGSDKAATGSAGTGGGNVVNVDVDASGNNNNQWSEGGRGGFDRVTVNGGEQPGDRPGNINITIHTQGSEGNKVNTGSIPSVVATAKAETHIHNHGNDGNGSKKGTGDGDANSGENNVGARKEGRGNGEDGAGEGDHNDRKDKRRDGEEPRHGGPDIDVRGDGNGEGVDVNQKVSQRPPINGGNGIRNGSGSGESGNGNGVNGSNSSPENGNGNGSGDNGNGITAEPHHGDEKEGAIGNGGKGGKGGNGKGDGKGNGERTGDGSTIGENGGNGTNGGDGTDPNLGKEEERGGGDKDIGKKKVGGEKDSEGKNGGKGDGNGDANGSGGKNGGPANGGPTGNNAGGDRTSENEGGKTGENDKLSSGNGNGGDGNSGGNGGKNGGDGGQGGDANKAGNGGEGGGHINKSLGSGAGGKGGAGGNGVTDGNGDNGGNAEENKGKTGGGTEDEDLTKIGGKDGSDEVEGSGAGAEGENGNNGSNGPNGTNGLNNGNGGNGPDGVKGVNREGGVNGKNGKSGAAGSAGTAGTGAVSGNGGGDDVDVQITNAGKPSPFTPSSAEGQHRQANSSAEQDKSKGRKEHGEEDGKESDAQTSTTRAAGGVAGNNKQATTHVAPGAASSEQRAQMPTAQQPNGPSFKHQGVSPLLARVPFARFGVAAAAHPGPVPAHGPAPAAADAGGAAHAAAAPAPAADAPAAAPGAAPAADPPALMAAMQKMNCFAADSLVTTVTGRKRMDQLQVGDFVLVPSAGNVLKYERVEMFYHREPETRAQFVVLITQHGHKLALTPLHLLPFGKCSDMQSSLNSAEGVETILGASRFAYSAKVGDCVLSLNDDGELIADKIIKVGRQLSEGIYSPMTVEGALLVDGVLASCFSQLESHSVQKTVFDFLMFVNDIFRIGYGRPVEEQSVPSFVGYVHSLSQYVLPFAKY